MADLTREQIQRLARLGAAARLEELRREEAAIRKAFPGLARGRQAGGSEMPGRPPRGGDRSTMSAAARKAVSERMKKYWAERRKSKDK
ncbi:MAG TPA: hypothetical protein VHU82_15485 [Vicinamibacterales bacterium]|nr:hypothetical protein [Vicinamibacterales bacterium]